MRTTLTIDDDVLAMARAMAIREQKSIGDVISALVRQALQPRQPTGDRRNGIPLLPARAGSKPVTPELVNELRDELP